MSEDTTKFELGQMVTILDVKKEGEVIEVMENGQYQVRYTDDAGTFQTEICAPEKLAPVGGNDGEDTGKEAGTETGAKSDDENEEDEKEEEKSDEKDEDESEGE